MLMAGCNSRLSLPWQCTREDILAHILQPATMLADHDIVVSSASLNASMIAATLQSKQHSTRRMGMPKMQPLLPSSYSTIQYVKEKNKKFRLFSNHSKSLLRWHPKECAA